MFTELNDNQKRVVTKKIFKYGKESIVNCHLTVLVHVITILEMFICICCAIFIHMIM